jgi:hypothetical protein
MRDFVKGLVLSSLLGLGLGSVTLAAGCKGKEEGGATCEAVVEHMLTLVKQTPQFKSAKPEEQKQAVDLIEKGKAQAIQDCKAGDGKLEQKVMDCILAAKDIADTEKCKPTDTAAPEVTAPPAADATATPPAEGTAPATPPADGTAPAPGK